MDGILIPCEVVRDPPDHNPPYWTSRALLQPSFQRFWLDKWLRCKGCILGSRNPCGKENRIELASSYKIAWHTTHLRKFLNRNPKVVNESLTWCTLGYAAGWSCKHQFPPNSLKLNETHHLNLHPDHPKHDSSSPRPKDQNRAPGKPILAKKNSATQHNYNI
jgi:hypothetical protein